MKNRKITLIAASLIAFLLFLPLMSGASAATETVVSATTSNTHPGVGDTIIVTVQILNVHNLFNLGVVLDWNPVVLSFNSVQFTVGVEINQGGVLHGTNVVGNPQSVRPGDIYLLSYGGLAYNEPGEYNVYAGCTNDETPAFSGNGTLAYFNFTVTNPGDAGLKITPQLSSKFGDGINTLNMTDSVTAVSESAAKYQTMPTIQSYQTPQQTATPTPSPTSHPNLNSGWLSTAAVVAGILVVVAAVGVVVFRKKATKKQALA
jgi:hypothetical protein